VIIYKIPGKPWKFEIIWESKISVFKTGPGSLKDIQDELITKGYVITKSLLSDVLSGLMDVYILNDFVEIRTEIETLQIR